MNEKAFVELLKQVQPEERGEVLKALADLSGDKKTTEKVAHEGARIGS